MDTSILSPISIPSFLLFCLRPIVSHDKLQILAELRGVSHTERFLTVVANVLKILHESLPHRTRLFVILQLRLCVLLRCIANKVQV